MGKRKLERVAKGLYKRYGKDGEAFSWVAMYAGADGKIKRKTLKARTRKDAETELRKLKGEVDELREKGYLPRTNPELTVNDLIKDYVDYLVNHTRASRAQAEAPGKALLRILGPDRKAISLSKKDIEDYIKTRRKENKAWGVRDPESDEKVDAKVSIKTIKNEVLFLKAAFNRAIDNEELDRNPADRVRFKKIENERKYTIEAEDLDRLIEHCATDHLGFMVLMAWETGMRQDEVVSLQWDRVDLDSGLINLLPEDTKTGEGRRVPISEILLDRLLELRAAQASQSTDIEAMPYVFRYEVKEVFHNVKTFPQKSFDRARRKAGLYHPAWGWFRFHDLRHCFVTRKLNDGVPERVVEAITGHKTDSMRRRYDSGPSDAELVKSVSGNLHKTYTSRKRGHGE